MHRGLLRQILTAWVLLLCWAAAQAAAPAAGSVISNTALASYVDSGSGTSVRLTSNTVNTRVSPQEALTLASDHALALAPGVQFALGHVLTNTGNVVTNYDLAITVLPSSGFVPLDLVVVHDVNRNGRADAGEPQVGATGIELAPGATAQLLLAGTVPPSAGAGQAAQLELEAVSRNHGARARSVDTLTVTTGAAPQLILSTPVAATRPGDTVDWQLTASNNGNLAAGPVSLSIDGAAASAWLMRMPIPGNTVFAAARPGTPAGARLLYHLAGAAADSYVSAVPAGATVDAVAWAHPALQPGALAQGRFSVTVNGNAAGRILGMAQSDWSDGGARRLTASNTLLLPLPDRAPAIQFFASAQYSTAALQTTAGRPLYVQADAAMCNGEPLRADTVPVTVASQLSGDVEIYTAVETAPNSGLFRILPDVPTASAALRVVAIGNGVLEVLRNDTVSATITSCGAVAAQASTDLLIDPSGVVFDSRSNLPLAGATVELLDVTGAGNDGRPGEPAIVFAADGSTRAPSSLVTGADGVFVFPLVRPSTYRLRVTPPRGFTFPSALPVGLQPAGRVIEPAGSYGRDFRVDTRPVNFDVPLDTGGADGLVLEKRANKAVAEVGGFVDYTVRVANVMAVPLPRVEVLDNLPAGFAYVAGSARLDGAALADPVPAGGGQLRFALGTLAPASTAVLGYRVRLGPGSLGGTGVNTAQASGSGVSSNRASARVQVVGGVFADDAYMIGKVYADCNANRVQDPGEAGVPGVRVYLDDGTYAVADEDGKYSLYGLTPRTHVAKVDRTTLPAGATLQVLDQRNGDDAGSRFVDLTHGELHRADFAVAGCGPALDAQIAARRQALNRPTEITQAAALLPSTVAPSAVDPRTLPASGTLGLPGAAPLAGESAAQPALGAVADAGGSQAAALQGAPAPLHLQPAPAVEPGVAAMEPASQEQPLEELLPQLSPEAGFINLREGQVLPTAQTRVRVKGPLGAAFVLTLDGQAVSERQVGKRSSLPQTGVSAWEYIGVDLRPGRNTFAVAVKDPFGNLRGRAEVMVLAPGPLATVRVGLPDEPVADAATPFAVDVLLEDANGLPVTARTRVTLQASTGQWQVTDAEPAQPGVQAFVEGGAGRFLLLPSAHPGPLDVSADAGLAKGEARTRLVPKLRPLIAAGIVEGVLNLRNLSPSALQPAQGEDVFERQIRSASRSFDGGKDQAGVRASLFLKGKVLGSSLLTLAYDSEKSDTRLLRDIQPDRFYPVYGDSSVRGFEAQSTGRLYVLLQNGSNYALVGDFLTQSDNAVRQLTQYARALHGAKGRWSNGTVTLEGFASRTAATRVVQEFRANGTSGPFRLDPAMVARSEQVRILTRSRDQLAHVIEETALERFLDYTIDRSTGLLLLKAPVPSVDADLNPVFIRVSYEVDEGGPRHTVGGAEMRVQVAPGVTVGALAVRDEDPANRQDLQGLTLEARPGEKTLLTAEIGRSRTDLQGEGSGQRVELRHAEGRLQAHAWGARTDAGFYNPGSPQSAGQAQYGAKAGYLVDERNRVVLEALRTAQGTTGAEQAGAELRLEHALGGNAKLEVGVRYSRSNAQALRTGPALPGTATPVIAPVPPPAATDTVGYTSARVKLTAPVPGLPQAEVFGVAEVAIDGSDGREIGVGANYALDGSSRLYLRHNFIQSLNGPYTLSTDFARYTTVVGVDILLPDSTQLFNEYRIGGSIDGRAAEAAVGLRRTLRLDNGVGLTGAFQRIRQVGGRAVGEESTALSLGVDYTAPADWKGSAQAQWQTSTSSRSWLLTGAMVQKLGPAWTLLNRALYHTEESSGGRGERRLVTAQAGAAYRPVDDNRWNALARIELRDDRDSMLGPGADRDETALILSTHLNVQPTRDWTLRARIAAKRAEENANGVASTSTLRLAGLRATWELASRWDLGLQGYRLWGDGAAETALGLELGYMLMQNLWVSVGYNFKGFDLTELAGAASTQRGAYLRLRYKFDETLLGAGEAPAATPVAAEPKTP